MPRRIAIPSSRRARRAPLGPPAAPSGLALTPSPLERAARRLADRLALLEERVDAGEEAAWPAYLELLRTLATLLPALSPAQHRLLTTAELAARLGVSPKTLRKRRAMGLARPAFEHGRLLRWRADLGLR